MRERAQRTFGIGEPDVGKESGRAFPGAPRLTPRCCRIGSSICWPIESIGCRDVIGSWNTIPIPSPRMLRRALPLSARRSSPRKRARPVAVAPDGSRPISASTDIVLPLPLSPATPKTSLSATRVVDTVDDRHRASSNRHLDPQVIDLEQMRAHRTRRLSCAVRGSNTSRRLSPRKLKAITAVKIARPGNVPIHQYWKYCVPVATIAPHSG